MNTPATPAQISYIKDLESWFARANGDTTCGEEPLYRLLFPEVEEMSKEEASDAIGWLKCEKHLPSPPRLPTSLVRIFDADRERCKIIANLAPEIVKIASQATRSQIKGWCKEATSSTPVDEMETNELVTVAYYAGRLLRYAQGSEPEALEELLKTHARKK